jgi:serine kinase of HPr protein (carbohydrate metabolism regulator)
MSGVQLHATCVSIHGKGVVLLGDSGCGKSDLALRLIEGGAVLVADDRVEITRHEEHLLAAPPDRLRGLIEARGVDILTLPYLESAPLSLAVSLVPRESVERLPEPKFWSCLDLQLPLLSLHPFDGSTCAKIRLVLQQKE